MNGLRNCCYIFCYSRTQMDDFGGPNMGAKRGNLEDLNMDAYRGAILGTVIQVCIEVHH